MIKFKVKQPKMDKRTYMKLKSVINDYQTFNDLFFMVAQRYIADVRGTDFVDHERTMLINRAEYEITCPDCRKTFNLSLEDIEND